MLKTVGLKGDEEEVEKWDLVSGDPVVSRTFARTVRSSPAEISLLLTNLHLDKAIKSLPECN